MKKATSAKGKPSVFYIGGTQKDFGVESEHDTFKYWRVHLDYLNNATCLGSDSGDRCWPFYQHGTCKHCDAVLAIFPDVATTRRAFTKLLRLEDLFEA